MEAFDRDQYAADMWNSFMGREPIGHGSGGTNTHWVETISAMGRENERLRQELQRAEKAAKDCKTESERLSDALWMVLWEKAGKPDGVYECFFPKYEHEGKWYPIKMPFAVMKVECLRDIGKTGN